MSAGIFERIENAYPMSARETEILSVVRRLAQDVIAPRAENYDSSGDFPWENIKALTDIELNRLFLPEEFGGVGASYSCYLRVVLELSRGCPATAITWATTYHALSPLIEFGTPEQKARFLPRVAAGALAALAITEEGGGSDIKAMQSSLRPDGDLVHISGRKLFITNGDVAELCLLFGKWSEIADERGSITAVIIEKGTPGLSVTRKEEKLGHRASSTVELSFDDCLVPRNNLLGKPGDGFPILLAALNKSRPSIAAHALGIGRAAFDEASLYANNRKQFGGPLMSFQGVRFIVADMMIKLAMAEAWLLHLGHIVDVGATNFDVEASILKVAATDAAMEIASNAVQLYGGAGYIRGSKVERLFRDAKLTQIWEGANELHRDRIGRSMWTTRDGHR